MSETPSALWVIILTLGAATIGFRLAFFTDFFDHDEWPPWLNNALGYVAPAALAGLVVHSVLYEAGSLQFSVGNFEIWAAVAALFVSIKFGGILKPVLAGMGTLWLLVYVVPL